MSLSTGNDQEYMAIDPVTRDLRIMYVGNDELRPGQGLARMRRGKKRGVDYNHDMQWLGPSAGLSLNA